MSGFGRLVEAEIPRLRRYARALAHDPDRADDLVQSCIARALLKQHLYRPGTNLRAWLFTILHHQYVSEFRRSAREANASAFDDVALAPTVQPNAIPRLQLRDLEVALSKVPGEQRQVILLVGLEGMRYDQVAEILDIPVGTVQSRLWRGRKVLRRLMGMDERLETALPIPPAPSSNDEAAFDPSGAIA